MDKKRIAIFDVDGVISDHRHREHHVLKDPKNWDSFYAEMGKDLLVQDTFQLMKSLVNNGWEIIFITGREMTIEKYHTTINWFKDNEIYIHGNLHMRPENDRREDYEIKEEKVRKYVLERNYDVIIAFDDRIQNIEMYKRLGITCFHTFIK